MCSARLAAVRRPRRADLRVAAVVALIAQVETWLSAASDPKITFAAAALAMTAPLAWHRSTPLLVLAMVSSLCSR